MEEIGFLVNDKTKSISNFYGPRVAALDHDLP